MEYGRTDRVDAVQPAFAARGGVLLSQYVPDRPLQRGWLDPHVPGAERTDHPQSHAPFAETLKKTVFPACKMPEERIEYQSET